jgi:hypothetical protein
MRPEREDRHVFTPGWMRVRCQGALHEIELIQSGILLLHDHVEDADAQKVMEGLSGKSCRCYQVDRMWREFLRRSNNWASTAVPIKLPARLRDEGCGITEVRRARLARDRERSEWEPLQKTGIFAMAFQNAKRNHSKNVTVREIAMLRIRACCQRIVDEVAERVTCPVEPPYRNAGAVYTTGFYDGAGRRPSIFSADEPVYGDSARKIVGIDRSLKINAAPHRLVETYLKTRCLALDGDRVVALVALLGPYRGSRRKHVGIAGRLDDDGTVESCRCVVVPDEPLWRVERWQKGNRL